MNNLERICTLLGTALLCSSLPFAVAISNGISLFAAPIASDGWTLLALTGIALVAVPSLNDIRKFYRVFLILAMSCLCGLLVILPYQAAEGFGQITGTLLQGSALSSLITIVLLPVFNVLGVDEPEATSASH